MGNGPGMVPFLHSSTPSPKYYVNPNQPSAYQPDVSQCYDGFIANRSRATPLGARAGLTGGGRRVAELYVDSMPVGMPGLQALRQLRDLRVWTGMGGT